MRTEIDRTSFSQRIFAQLHSKPLVLNLLQQVIPELQLHGILLPKELIAELLDKAYMIGVDGCASSSSDWAMTNALYAAAMRHNTARGSLGGLSPIIWSYFKNAFAVFPELIIQAPELRACEALLAMAVFMLGTADARVTSQLTTAAAQLSHSLGLHRQCYYHSLGDVEAEHCRRVFWMTYTLNAEVTHKNGLPSIFQNQEISLELSSGSSAGEKIPGYYRKLTEIAVIQLRIHNLLPADKLFKNMDGKLLEDVRSTHKELQLWKKSLPQHLQEPNEISDEDPDIAIALLHFKYYSCAAKFHVGISRIVVFECPSPGDDLTRRSNQSFSSTKMARDMAASTARGIIGLLSHLPLQPFSQVW
ncbi:hypothetical protein N0V90_011305 [Kalmusia sp. IMI 367209]|nr:hypothetical protein N0V90_011305 [Kalmusia sp. IMI 367209]